VTRLSLLPAHAVVAVAGSVHAQLVRVGVPSRRLHLLPNGIDTHRFGEPATRHLGEPRVLFVGGLTPRKGVLDLIEASSQLYAEGLRHELWLAGGTPDEGAEAEGDVQSRLPAHARLLGQVDPEAMPDVYAAADVFVLPSWWEAMPLTVLEAQASGLPVVATRVGDVEQMVVEGVTGHLVPAHDPPALAEALRALLTSPERRRAMGAAAREHVSTRFAEARMVDGLRAVYEAVERARP
jgi:glycosyltransferase involved in cell wall biosynthesis